MQRDAQSATTFDLIRLLLADGVSADESARAPRLSGDPTSPSATRAC
jgi:hypothetical protein